MIYLSNSNRVAFDFSVDLLKTPPGVLQVLPSRGVVGKSSYEFLQILHQFGRNSYGSVVNLAVRSGIEFFIFVTKPGELEISKSPIGSQNFVL